MLTLAIPKGRMLDPCLALLMRAGFTDKPEAIKESRKLSFDLNKILRLVAIRNTDLIPYVMNNIADMAFIGSDILLEDGNHTDYYDYTNLGIGRCRLMTAAARKETKPSWRIKVATKYPRIARDFYAAQGIQADIVKVRGAVELAVITGLADQIVDIVDTGQTLRANNLYPMDTIADVAMRLIINKGALKSKWQFIDGFVAKLTVQVNARTES